MEREFGKEILKCFWVHCNTAYDAMIHTGGNQGITAGYGQLITLSGVGAAGLDTTNDLTYALTGGDRRDDAHFGAQAQRAPAPRHARRNCWIKWWK